MSELHDLNGATIAFDLERNPGRHRPRPGRRAEHHPGPGSPAAPALRRGAADGRPRRPRPAGARLRRRRAPLGLDRAPTLVERFIAVYLDRIADESAPFPGVVEVLTELKADGARLVVCTNKLTNLSVALLDAVGLTPHFDAVIGADLAPAPKPDGRHVAAAIAAVGGDLARAVMVGDSINDALGARNAGVPGLLVSFGYTEDPVETLGADLVIHSFLDVPRACKTLLASCPAPNTGL
ncbi:HAD-IA family hydrolase [Caulobacter sp. UC70_42]|uniref:HAD-IA family hydrolase n=1 Tax=Caulobacter sp. UC70_42 TaxID=3374551 RepID=UPI003756C79E